jgi:hypothetical protein
MSNIRKGEVILVAVLIAFVLAWGYCAVAKTTYRFRHAEMTETQLWLNWKEWLLRRE